MFEDDSIEERRPIRIKIIRNETDNGVYTRVIDAVTGRELHGVMSVQFEATAAGAECTLTVFNPDVDIEVGADQKEYKLGSSFYQPVDNGGATPV